jgi:hypothetical protein
VEHWYVRLTPAQFARLWYSVDEVDKFVVYSGFRWKHDRAPANVLGQNVNVHAVMCWAAHGPAPWDITTGRPMEVDHFNRNRRDRVKHFDAIADPRAIGGRVVQWLVETDDW